MVQCRVAYRKSRSSGLLDFTSTREGRIARRSNSEPFAMKLNKLSSYLRNTGADSATLRATAVEWRLRIVSLSRFSGGNTGFGDTKPLRPRGALNLPYEPNSVHVP